MLRSICLLLFLLLQYNLTPLSGADTISTWDHSGDGSASGNGADTSVSEHSPAARTGEFSRLHLRFNSHSSQPRNSIIAIRFDWREFAPLTASETYTLELFDLRFAEPKTSQAKGKPFNLWVLTNTDQANWNESTVTWAEGFPGHMDDNRRYNGPDFTQKVTFLQSFTFQGSGNQGWSAPIHLKKSALDILRSIQGSTVTLMITAAHESATQYRFASKEDDAEGVGARAPRLGRAEMVVVPEETFGWNTKGGHGGQVIKVTNLRAEGPGSLREALETKGPRIVVFEVGGVIDMGGVAGREMLSVTEPYLTLAGQTAPSPGITIIRGGIRISTHDVIVQHLRIRPGDAGHAKKSGWEPDALSAVKAHNVLFDHISATWAVDEGISASGKRNLEPFQSSYNITFSNCLIAENLHDSSHKSGPHSKGSLIHDHVRGIAILRCLYASNDDRNPYFKAETTGVIANNVIYNPGTRAIQYGYTASELDTPPEPAHLSVVGNVYREGPSTKRNVPLIRITHSKVGDLYLSDNLALSRTGTDLRLLGGKVTQVARPVSWPENFTPMKASETWEHVLAHAGARPNENNAIDHRIKQTVRSGTGRIIHSQTEVGGYPVLTPTRHLLQVPAGADEIQKWLQKWAEKWEPTSPQTFSTSHFTIMQPDQETGSSSVSPTRSLKTETTP